MRVVRHSEPSYVGLASLSWLVFHISLIFRQSVSWTDMFCFFYFLLNITAQQLVFLGCHWKEIGDKLSVSTSDVVCSLYNRTRYMQVWVCVLFSCSKMWVLWYTCASRTCILSLDRVFCWKERYLTIKGVRKWEKRNLSHGWLHLINIPLNSTKWM